MEEKFDILYAKEAEHRNLSYKVDTIHTQRKAKVAELAEYENDITKE